MTGRAELIRLFTEGNVPGETTVPKHIDTVISDVFLFENRAYKISKDHNPHAAISDIDLSQKEDRFTFIKEDFAWNNSICSETYLLITGARVKNGKVEFVPEEQAEELVWVMRRLPEMNLFYSLLRGNDLYTDDYLKIGRLYSRRENAFVPISDPPELSILDLALADCADTDAWGRDVQEIDSREWESWMVELYRRCQESLSGDTRPAQPAFDMVSLNAFYLGNTFLPLDTHPWKKSWRFRGTHTNAYRLAADIWAFTGEKNARLFLKGYGEVTSRGKLTKKDEPFWILFGALIMLPYLYRLGRKEPEKKDAADQYLSFVRACAKPLA